MPGWGLVNPTTQCCQLCGGCGAP